MNLAGTLAKVAIGVIAAKGIGGLLGKAGGGSQQAGGGGLGGLLGGLTGGGQQMGDSGAGGAGGLGGLGGLLGGLAGGGAGQAGGGLGGLLDSLSGGAGGAAAGGAAAGGLGGLLNQALGGQAVQPTQEQNTEAEILLRGMLNAAKSDGEIDNEEQAKFMEHLKDATEEEMAFVREEINKPLDADAYIASIPQGMGQQVYLMSLLSINLDSQAEAQYLDKLAKGVGISPQESNAIHAKVGVPALYS